MLQELEELEGKEAQAEASELPAAPKVPYVHTLWACMACPVVDFFAAGCCSMLVGDSSCSSVYQALVVHDGHSADTSSGCAVSHFAELSCTLSTRGTFCPVAWQVLCHLEPELVPAFAPQLWKEEAKPHGTDGCVYDL